MARYDYRCPACHHVFEVEHGMNEKPTVHCPKCGTEASRVFEASGITLKGSGFYNTDMRGSGGSGSSVPAPSEGSPSNSSDSESSGSTVSSEGSASSDSPSSAASTSDSSSSSEG